MKKIIETIQKKWAEYLLEMIVIIASILGAFALDTWKENQMEIREETTILKDLEEEFRSTLIEIDSNINHYKDAMNHKINVLKLFGSDKILLDQLNVDSLLNYSFPSSDFHPTNITLEEIIQSGKFKLLKNKELRKSLFKIIMLTSEFIEREEKLDKWTFEIELPYISKYGSIKQMDGSSNYSWGGKSNLDVNNYQLFQQLEFENIVDNSIFLQQKKIEAFKKLAEAINQCILLMK